MSKVRSLPCEACPYRRDVPSGVWSAVEYHKLIDYDAPTGEQPIAEFACHASPNALCHGWAVVHSNRGHENELLALRIRDFNVIVGLEPPVVIPAPVVPLFSSGAEAAEHGLRDIDDPSDEAKAAAATLMRKHPRLRDDYRQDGDPIDIRLDDDEIHGYGEEE